jgi:hypothetical protein
MFGEVVRAPCSARRSGPVGQNSNDRTLYPAHHLFKGLARRSERTPEGSRSTASLRCCAQRGRTQAWSTGRAASLFAARLENPAGSRGTYDVPRTGFGSMMLTECHLSTPWRRLVAREDPLASCLLWRRALPATFGGLTGQKTLGQELLSTLQNKTFLEKRLSSAKKCRAFRP